MQGDNNRTVRCGGLYKNVKMSIRTANVIVLIGIAALVIVFSLLVSNNGFIISFDSRGGTEVESVKAMYGDMLNDIPEPTKEGYVFKGWYLDRACTVSFNSKTDEITQSMTLFAGWEENS